MEGKVYPVYDNIFKFGAKGTASTEDDMVTVANLENFAPKIDGNVVEWDPMDQKGWGDAMMTGKKLSFSFTGKRTYGDPGNDYIAGLAWLSGNDVVTPFEWEMPSGTKAKFNCIINVTTPGGGNSNDVDTLEFEVKCKGKPTITPAENKSAEITGE